MTEIATRDGSGLALRSDQEFWTDKQRAALEQLGVADASNADLAVFLHVAQRSGLDPFARQVYMIGRREKTRNDTWITKQTIQTGIDGYRLIARRAADRAGEKFAEPQPLWCGQDMQWLEAWPFEDTPPAACKVTVYRDGEPFGAVAMFHEFCQRDRAGNPTSMWRKMPANQLAKCAEAQALRKAYPQELAGLYVDEEMQQADNPARGPQRAPAAARVTVDELDAAGGSAQRYEQIAQRHPHVVDAEPAEPSHPTSPEPVGDQRPATRQQVTKLILMLRDLDVETDEDQHAWLSEELRRPVTSRNDLTRGEASTVIEVLQTLIAARDAETDGAGGGNGASS
jgi:phage recombination protein Bet